MKKVIIILTLIFGVQSLHSQAALFALIFGDKVASENFNIGLEIGFPYANLSEVEGNSGKLGLNFGMSGNIKLNEQWSIHPSAFFLSNRGVELDALSLNSSNAELNSNFQNVPAKLKLSYIDVPVFINYRFSNSNFKVGLAPQISFRTSANAVFTNDQGDFDFDIKDQTSGTDFGMIAQVGYIWYNKKFDKEVHIHLRYYQGFSDAIDDGLVAGNNEFNYLGISLSFPFVKKSEKEEE